MKRQMYEYIEIPIYTNKFMEFDGKREEISNSYVPSGDPPIAGHYSNPLTWIIINNIGYDAVGKKAKRNDHAPYAKCICIESYENCIRNLIIRHNGKIQIFGSPQEYNQLVIHYKENRWMTPDQFDDQYGIHPLRSFGEIMEIHPNMIKLKVDVNDRFFNLIKKAECNGELFAFIRAEFSNAPIRYTKTNLPIYECNRIISFDIILPDEYYDEFIKAKESELRPNNNGCN